VVSPFENPIQFGFDIDSTAETHLQRAANLVGDRQESLAALQEAYQAAPDQLETLVAMFKLYFYQGETEKAESIVWEALKKSSRVGDFSTDWLSLDQASTNWSDPRGPGRHYLYSLKALAFIRLRQDDQEGAGEILKAMQTIDPDDLVGAAVIRDLLRGLEGEDG
jgi:tetratricopeptide (TPR) repeat protein